MKFAYLGRVTTVTLLCFFICSDSHARGLVDVLRAVLDGTTYEDEEGAYGHSQNPGMTTLADEPTWREKLPIPIMSQNVQSYIASIEPSMRPFRDPDELLNGGINQLFATLRTLSMENKPSLPQFLREHVDGVLSRLDEQSMREIGVLPGLEAVLVEPISLDGDLFLLWTVPAPPKECFPANKCGISSTTFTVIKSSTPTFTSDVEAIVTSSKRHHLVKDLPNGRYYFRLLAKTEYCVHDSGSKGGCENYEGALSTHYSYYAGLSAATVQRGLPTSNNLLDSINLDVFNWFTRGGDPSDEPYWENYLDEQNGGAEGNVPGFPQNGTLKNTRHPECQDVAREIYYMNGMKTKRMSAEPKEGASYQLARLQQLMPEYALKLNYVETRGLFKDFVEAAHQKGIERCITYGEDFSPIFQKRWFGAMSDAYRTYDTNIPVSEISGDFCGPDLSREEIFDDFVEAWGSMFIIARSYEEDDIATDADYQAHVMNYTRTSTERRSVTLVGYSQGSLYANFGYEWFRNNRPDIDVGVYHVGSVASTVPRSHEGLGGWLTYNNDAIVNLVRKLNPPVVAGNSEIDPPGGLNHSFVSYFDHELTRARIVSDLVRISETLPSEDLCPPEEEDVVMCGEPISQEGSTGDYRIPIDMGNRSGVVEFSFEAYNIPDRFVLTDEDSAVRYQTLGAVSGRHDGAVLFDGAPSGESAQWTGFVEGNRDANTRWDLTVGCPGQELPQEGSGPDEPPGEELVMLSIIYDTAGVSSDIQCAMTIRIDDQIVYSTPYAARTIHQLVELKPGRHSYEWDSQCEGSCGGISCDTWNDSRISQGFRLITQLPDPFWPRNASGSLIFEF